MSLINSISSRSLCRRADVSRLWLQPCECEGLFADACERLPFSREHITYTPRQV